MDTGEKRDGLIRKTLRRGGQRDRRELGEEWCPRVGGRQCPREGWSYCVDAASGPSMIETENCQLDLSMGKSWKTVGVTISTDWGSREKGKGESRNKVLFL